MTRTCRFHGTPLDADGQCSYAPPSDPDALRDLAGVALTLGNDAGSLGHVFVSAQLLRDVGAALRSAADAIEHVS